MSIAAVLALVDGGPGSEGALKTAVQLGRTFDAHVEVLHVKVDPETVIPVVAEGMSGAAVGQILESTRQGAEKRAEEAHRLFQELARSEALDLTTIEADPVAGRFQVAWHQTTGREPAEVARRGLLFDLIVVARPDAESAFGGVAALEAALFETGRPLIVAPAKAGKGSFDHVVLAWNGKREAARAVWAARPFLRRAAKVTTITVLEDEEDANPAELARYLARHGVTADTRLLNRGDGDVGEMLLKTAKDLGADLLAMGGYGHSRLRELVLGGATRSVVERAELPILMAH